MLRTRSPLYSGRSPFSLDLHVLSTPPAFVLSQDQTLQLKLAELVERDRLKVGARARYGFESYCTRWNCDCSAIRRYWLAIQFSETNRSVAGRPCRPSKVGAASNPPPFRRQAFFSTPFRPPALSNRLEPLGYLPVGFRGALNRRAPLRLPGDRRSVEVGAAFTSASPVPSSGFFCRFLGCDPFRSRRPQPSRPPPSSRLRRVDEVCGDLHPRLGRVKKMIASR